MKYKLNIDWNHFLANYWQKKPVVFKQALIDFVDPITPEELAGLAMENEIDSRLVSNKNGVWDVQFGPFTEFEQLNDDHCTLLVQAVDHWHSASAKLLEPFICLPQWQFDDLMISYATKHAGVGPHVDNYDVFIIQGKGSRRWTVGSRDVEHQQFHSHQSLRHVQPYQVVIDEELTSGDMIYIPLGAPHNGISLDDSISYSIGFRTQRTQDMISSFADYIIDKVVANDFYQDPNMRLPSDSYRVQDHELTSLQDQMVSLITNEEIFTDWFGQHITQSMHELDIVPVEPVYSMNEFTTRLQAGDTLVRVQSIRILKIRDKGFIHGEKIDLPIDEVNKLCALKRLKYEHICGQHTMLVMLDLLNKGYWYIED